MMDSSEKRRFKDALYTEFSRIGKALSSAGRLEMLDVLAQGEHTVAELADSTGLTEANASQHLQTLRQARLVEGRRSGKYVYYRLANKRVFRLWRALRDVGEHQLAEVDRLVEDYRRSRDELEPIGMDELLERMRHGKTAAIDVRPEEEYRDGHIAGARSIPVEELEARAKELPADTEVVAYCRGPYCLLSDEAVEILREHGISARRLDKGFPDWEVEGYPVERATSDTH